MSEPFVNQQVFRDSFSQGQVVCPPERVFRQADFVTLLTQNAYLFEDEAQYQSFLRVLVRLGERSFQLVENLGTTQSEPRAPYTASFSVESTYAQFQAVVAAFDPPVGFLINHFYLFGQHPTWSIYLCEWPTMTLIGCLPDLQQEFAHVFAIEEDGYAVLKEFIGREFQAAAELQALFEQNYKLIGSL